MGKGKKERSKKNKNKKETREPIKRKLEGKKHRYQTHKTVNVQPTHGLNGGDIGIAYVPSMYEKMFSN